MTRAARLCVTLFYGFALSAASATAATAAEPPDYVAAAVERLPPVFADNAGVVVRCVPAPVSAYWFVACVDKPVELIAIFSVDFSLSDPGFLLGNLNPAARFVGREGWLIRAGIPSATDEFEWLEDEIVETFIPLIENLSP